MGPAFTWGRHGVDGSNMYGQSVERENQLRLFEDGKLKSQVKTMQMQALLVVVVTV